MTDVASTTMPDWDDPMAPSGDRRGVRGRPIRHGRRGYIGHMLTFRSLNVENLFESARTPDGSRDFGAGKSSPRSSRSRGYRGVSIPRHDGHGHKSSQKRPQSKTGSPNTR